MFNLVTMILKALIFGVPVAFVAQWCDVQPTWKSMAFVVFCVVWADCVDWKEDGRRSSPDDPSAAGNRRAAAEILTPAQVAAEAQKLTPRPFHR